MESKPLNDFGWNEEVVGYEEDLVYGDVGV